MIIAVVLAVIVTSISILALFEIKAQKEQLRADGIEIVDSNILGEKRKLLVHLPKDYSANTKKRYDVIYALDATSHDQDVLNSATILSIAEQTPDLIIVGVVNKNRDRDLTPDYVAKDQDPADLGHGDKFLAFLEKEAIPLIEATYRTTDYRMISGHSRAGLFTFYCMVENPTLFDAYFCYSPAFWRSNNIIADRLHQSLVKTNQLNGFLYLSLGEKENEKMKEGFDKVIDILNQSDSLKSNIFHEYTVNANHGTNAYYSIPRALKIWGEQR